MTDVAEFEAAVAAWFGRHGLAQGTGPSRFREPDAYVRAARKQQSGLCAAGLAGITWPAAYGGRGLEVAHERAFARAAAGYELFGDVFTIGLGMCGPVLLALGTEEQKQRYLSAMLRADELWCQLFSEPAAGSDLAGVATTAVADGAGFVLTGQKVWNTYAQYSDFGLLLGRTDPNVPKHRGITMFVVDMRSPGVTVRPLRQATGDAEFNEVFLEDVRVPANAVVGGLGGGWRGATLMLSNERMAIGHDRNPFAGPVSLDRVVELINARGLDLDPVIRQRVGDLYARRRAIELFASQFAARVTAGTAPGPLASAGKLASGHLAKQIAALAMDVAGPEAAAWDPDDPDASTWAHGLLCAPSLSIAGGTDQIQRTILGERVLGLPREPQPDRDVPFRRLRRSG